MLMMEVDEQTTDNKATVPWSLAGGTRWSAQQKPVRDTSSTDAGKQEQWSAGCFTHMTSFNKTKATFSTCRLCMDFPFSQINILGKCLLVKHSIMIKIS